jgi:hypothetical protein
MNEKIAFGVLCLAVLFNSLGSLRAEKLISDLRERVHNLEVCHLAENRE